MKHFMTVAKLATFFILAACFSFFISCHSEITPTLNDSENNKTGKAITDLNSNNTPKFVEYWGVLPEYNFSNQGYVRGQDVPNGTNVVHIFVFDSRKTANGTWQITNRFINNVQKPEIPQELLTEIRVMQQRGIKVIFSIFTPPLTGATDALAFATAARDFVNQWNLDGIEIDLEGHPTQPYMLPTLGTLFGPLSNSGKILTVVDYNNYNLTHIANANQFLDYMSTMSYWNTSANVSQVLAPYAAAMGDPKKVLIGVGGGPAINPGQATPRGEEKKIAEWLNQNSPGTGMMNFIMDADYNTKGPDGIITRDMGYSQGILSILKPGN